MGKGLILSLVLALAGVAAAADIETIRMTDGPNGGGRLLGAAWKINCGPGARIAGLALHEEPEVIVSLEPLCVRLERKDGVLVWASAPARAKPPSSQRPETRSVLVARSEMAEAETDRQTGHILRVRSGAVSRFSGSRAMVISVGQMHSARDAAPSGPATLRVSDAPREMLCPEGQYIRGLRTGLTQQGELVALQMICSQPGRRDITVGDWPAGGLYRSPDRKTPQRLSENRIQCGLGGRNPHDGQAAQMLLGTAEYGRVQSLGLVCARAGEPGPVGKAAARTLKWLAALMPSQKVQPVWRVYQTPRWYAGADVAVCRDGSGRGYCAQATADRFCATIGGHAGASFYIVGGISSDAIAAGGKRCPSGACRAFRSITCAS